MQQKNYIKTSTLDEVKKQIEKLKEKGEPIVVCVKKTRSKIENYSVTVEATYAKIFTVRNTNNRLYFTVQYIDIVTGTTTVRW